MLTDVFGDRLRVKIREEMGGTYSPNAGPDLSDTYPGYGYLVADATVAPDQARAIVDAIKAVAASLQKDGVTEEEELGQGQATRAHRPARIVTDQRLLGRNRAQFRAGISATSRLEPHAL